jgi:RHS repeat-associated protein
VRVKEVYYDGVDTSTRLFLGGGSYEVRDAGGTGEEIVHYYALGGQRMMQDGQGEIAYLVGDHLGSVSAVLDETGILLSSQRFLPFGAVREDAGTITETDFGYTGQRTYGSLGLLDYHARWYSPSLGRFVQADTLVPDLFNPQSLNRYSYTLNNPVKYTDPSGHWVVEDPDDTSNDAYIPPGHSQSSACGYSSYASYYTSISYGASDTYDTYVYEPGLVGKSSSGVNESIEDELAYIESVGNMYKGNMEVPPLQAIKDIGWEIKYLDYTPEGYEGTRAFTLPFDSERLGLKTGIVYVTPEFLLEKSKNLVVMNSVLYHEYVHALQIKGLTTVEEKKLAVYIENCDDLRCGDLEVFVGKWEWEAHREQAVWLALYGIDIIDTPYGQWYEVYKAKYSDSE